MNENKYREILTAADVPQALDMRILSAARSKAVQRRHRRFILLRAVPAAGIAAAFCIGFGIIFFADSRSAAKQTPAKELLALNDWTELDQMNYNLTFELGNGISALADNLIAKGY